MCEREAKRLCIDTDSSRIIKSVTIDILFHSKSDIDITQIIWNIHIIHFK